MSAGLLTISVMYSMPICVAFEFINAYPSPISLVDLCIASVGKLGMIPSAFLAALFRILSIVSSCFFNEDAEVGGVIFRKKGKKKSLTMRACEGHRVLNGYAALYWRGGGLVQGN